MDINKLWAPWRSKYIRLSKQPRCIFCSATKTKQAAKKYVVQRTRHSLSMLNVYPYNNGHLLIAPRRHVKGIEGLTRNEIVDLMSLLIKSKKKLSRLLNPEGYNIGINLGRSSGAGVAAHLHIHLVPRWRGDTNFMTLCSGTKVISQSLDELYRGLTE